MSKFIFDIYDGQVPPVGSVLVGPRNRHLVLSVRPVDSRLWHDRWSIEVRRLAKDEEPPAGAQLIATRPYEKGECPHCIGRAAGVEVPDFVVCKA